MMKTLKNWQLVLLIIVTMTIAVNLSGQTTTVCCEELDQSNWKSVGEPTVTKFGDQWQSFTVGKSGFLTKIQVLHHHHTTSSQLMIYQGDGDLSEGKKLHEQSVSFTGEGIYTFKLEKPIAVTEGEKYTMRFTKIRWYTSRSFNYPGRRCKSLVGGDQRFQTYVSAKSKYQIGDRAHGGFVFWVDETGEHGLVAAPLDQGGDKLWPWWTGVSPKQSKSTKISTRLSDGIGAGANNSITLLRLIGEAKRKAEDNSPRSREFFAAIELCQGDIIPKTTESYGFGDWYLPSYTELLLMQINLHQNGIGNFSDSFYWSSTGLISSWKANGSNFGKSISDGSFRRSPDEKRIFDKARVRAVRAF